MAIFNKKNKNRFKKVYPLIHEPEKIKWERSLATARNDREFDSIDTFLSGANNLPSGTIVEVKSSRTNELLKVGQLITSPANLFRDSQPLHANQLSLGTDIIEITSGSGPATGSLTYGSNYVDFYVSGSTVGDGIIYNITPFGPGGVNESFLRDFGIAAFIDPDSDHSPATDSFFSVEMYNPSLDRYCGAIMIYTGTQWDRRIINDQGSGETITAVANGTNEGITVSAHLNLNIKNRGSANVTPTVGWNTSWSGGDINGETGLTSSSFISDTDDPAQFCRVRLHFRVNIGTLTVRIYYFTCNNVPGGINPH